MLYHLCFVASWTLALYLLEISFPSWPSTVSQFVALACLAAVAAWTFIDIGIAARRQECAMTGCRHCDRRRADRRKEQQ